MSLHRNKVEAITASSVTETPVAPDVPRCNIEGLIIPKESLTPLACGKYGLEPPHGI
jgi:hypothetical protein